MFWTRRAFVKLAAVAAGIFSIFPAAIARAKMIAINLSTVKDVGKVGGSAVVKVEGETLLVVRTGAQDVSVLTAICTHEGCEVAFHAESNQIRCPCHESAYDLTGKNVSGPAPKPLKRFPAKLQGERVIVKLG